MEWQRKQRWFLQGLAGVMFLIHSVVALLAWEYAPDSLMAGFLWCAVLFSLAFFNRAGRWMYYLLVLLVGVGLVIQFWQTVDLMIDFRAMAKAYELAHFPALGAALVLAGVMALLFIPFWALIWSDWRQVHATDTLH